MGRVGQEDGHQHDEAGTQEGPEDAAQATDDDHEQHEERERDVEGQRLRAAQIEEDELGAGHATVEGRDREGEQLRPEWADPDDLGGDVPVADGHPRAAHPAAPSPDSRKTTMMSSHGNAVASLNAL